MAGRKRPQAVATERSCHSFLGGPAATAAGGTKTASLTASGDGYDGPRSAVCGAATEEMAQMNTKLPEDTIRPKGMQCIPLLTGLRASVFWGDDLRRQNFEFLKSLDPGYFQFVADS